MIARQAFHTCTSCGSAKPSEDFLPSRTPSGVSRRCRRCVLVGARFDCLARDEKHQQMQHMRMRTHGSRGGRADEH